MSNCTSDLRILQGFDLKEMLYTDFKPLPDNVEKEIGARYVEDVGDMVR